MKTITSDIKAKIFAQYLGCKMLHNSATRPEHIYEINYSDDYSKYELLLKPLSEISDEDLDIISEILGVIYPKNFVNSIIENSNYAVNSTLCINTIQYLQSKGYALPYLDYSVDDLVELGVYKLTQ